ncbi:DUF1254 domain-containing protein [Mycobacterium sp. CBMA293]|uniref:DUF1254 domain-containing protein n=1 Tax=unclassified Mycolicibacterium TaxID=2636767 RepID=UPI0012DED247|nr:MULTISPECIES: DUF1254 domain-containing protein [unclassified Mycolicibacterium]MUL47728.1 DUF1254 domain-containing protein [Mycolicibacterium sp. CBMA 360]MUL61754.1 DUF1254 domain-containing protein [Mycolicibacterium sp. CBMA 335]MUL70818.1 DUF1254 domain-containing protein [Mycolicibacterium sp. CBMA 311]MUL92956.1 DUF1254 domain-containing protein [Mycolicibacterium sp. CBMA 230]MUM08602.1 hypothetical protein [Mycolicibacterium sp. CBMA 213]
MSVDILWLGAVFIAMAALVILGGPSGRRAYGAEAAAPRASERPDEVTVAAQALSHSPLHRLVPASDALYVDRFLDVSTEPWVLTLPDAADHSYLFQVLSGRADVFSDEDDHVAWTQPTTYAITGPNWNGDLPAGVTEHRSLAPIIWLIGRIECGSTPKDSAAVRALLCQISLVPLSVYEKRSGVTRPKLFGAQ